MSRTELTEPKQARARETRRRTVDAAYRLFCERGYAVSLTEIAAAARVSVQNVYVSFRNKRNLAREALELAVHGPELDLPPHEQPWFQDVVAARDATAAIAVWVTNLLPIYARVAPLAPMFISEPELAEVWERSEELRMFGFTEVMKVVAPKGTLAPGLDDRAGVEVMFVLLSPLVYQEFVGRLAWRPERWGDFTTGLLATAIFTHNPGAASRRGASG